MILVVVSAMVGMCDVVAGLTTSVCGLATRHLGMMAVMMGWATRRRKRRNCDLLIAREVGC
jgi:hypothetical protein